jgi:hypothetical protein
MFGNASSERLGSLNLPIACQGRYLKLIVAKASGKPACDQQGSLLLQESRCNWILRSTSDSDAIRPKGRLVPVLFNLLTPKPCVTDCPTYSR